MVGRLFHQRGVMGNVSRDNLLIRLRCCIFGARLHMWLVVLQSRNGFVLEFMSKVHMVQHSQAHLAPLALSIDILQGC